MKNLNDLPGKLCVPNHGRFRLKEASAGHTHGWEESNAVAESARLSKKLEELQFKLYADGSHAVLIVLQAIDGGGKDGTIRHALSSFNPQGCTVHSFKQPSTEELRHDYLWRVHAHVPPRGEIAIFNRSHYEDVLIARVDQLVPRATWKERYRQINEFEHMLTQNRTHIVKIFLHISKAEQRRRLAERARDPSKQWKFDPKDLVKRRQWASYRKAFEDMLNRCTTDHAVWYVVPANHKWFRNLAVAQIVHETLKSLALRFPKPRYNPRIRIA